MGQDLEGEVDRLYQLPLDAFTAARNQLAKGIDREQAARIRALEKPSLPAWAVNQLYWQDRRVFDALVKAAERWRDAQRAMLAGKKAADLSKLQGAHREAIDAALARASHAVREAGHTMTSATSEAISCTLESLPAPHTPGRLTAPLQPAGFEALAGLTLVPPKPTSGGGAAPGGSRPSHGRHDPPPMQIVGSGRARGKDRTDASGDEVRRAAGRAEAEEAQREHAEREEVQREQDQQAIEEARTRLKAAEAAVARLLKQVEHAKQQESRMRDVWEGARDRLTSLERELDAAKRDEATARRAPLR